MTHWLMNLKGHSQDAGLALGHLTQDSFRTVEVPISVNHLTIARRETPFEPDSGMLRDLLDAKKKIEVDL